MSQKTHQISPRNPSGSMLSAAGRSLCLGLIRLYQVGLSPVLGPRCRHYPSCSSYAAEAIEIHGTARGGLLALKRLGRCHPWGTHGVDPVPAITKTSER